MAERMARAARAAQQLCDVLWEAMHDELRLDPDVARVAELSERLAEVSSTMAMLAAATPAPAAAPPPHAPVTAPRSDAPAAAMPEAPAPDPPMRDRRTPPEPSPIPSGTGGYAFTKLVDEQEPAPPAEPLATVQPIQPEIEIRDVRREEGPSAWVSSVGRLLARHAEDGLPFAVLARRDSRRGPAGALGDPSRPARPRSQGRERDRSRDARHRPPLA